MVVLGMLSCLSVIATRWGPKRRALVDVGPVLSGVGD
jgi:hypothetical protein